jgi:Fic family protein
MAERTESMHESPHGPGLDEVDDLIVVALKEAKDGLKARDLLDALGRLGRPISQATLSRRMERLTELRHVTRQGQARATRYLRDPYHDYFAVPPTRRKAVGYNADVLANYRPNVDRWLSAEECRRLEEAGGGRRMDASTYSRTIAQKLLIDLSYASSALEGNTYTYLDTQVLIEFGQVAEGKDLDETRMILNHKEAINHILEYLADIEISVRDIKDIHALLSRGLRNMGPYDTGRVRRMPVDHIGGSSYVPLVIPQRIEEELETIAAKAQQIDNPFEQCLFLLTFISYLQAFKDVNKRTGRLVCNIPLLKAGLAPFTFIDLDKTQYVHGLLAFYELNRVDLIKDAFVEGYIRSAARYDAYSERPKEVVEIEFRRRDDIQRCIQAYVAGVIGDTTSDVPADFAAEHFAEEGEERTRNLLVDRVTEIVEALDEGNHIAYGLSRATFAGYQEALKRRAEHQPQ